MHPKQYRQLKLADGVQPFEAAFEAGGLTEPGPECAPQKARAPPLPDDDHLLTSRQVQTRFGSVSIMSLWRWMHNPAVDFPRPKKINGRNYWRLGDLRAWQAERTG